MRGDRAQGTGADRHGGAAAGTVAVEPRGQDDLDEPVPYLLPSDRFRVAVRRTGVGAARDIPHLSAELVLKYATDLRRLMTG
ncbi:hypothetical protein ACE1SV_62490 [Streptomyces sp. E-15]